MIISSTTIVQLCSKLAALSSNQAGLVTSDFLNFSNLVMTVLTSELLAARSEYLLYQDSIPVVSGTSAIRIPYRAVNGDVRHLWYEDGTGSRTKLDLLLIEDIENFSVTDSSSPQAFYMMGNNVMLLPTPSQAGNVVFIYPFRPNLLVDATTAQSILSTAGNTVTLANVPPNFSSGVLYDIIDNLSGNGIVYYDQMGSISGNTITFTNNVPLANVGNYVALAGQSPVPMIPEEGHSLLLETTVMRLETIRGNAQRIKNSAQIVADARKAWDMLLLNRVVSKAYPAGNGGPQSPNRPW